MAFPRRLLNEDEEVAFDLRPHWKVVAGAALLAPVIVGLGAFLIGVAGRELDGSAETFAQYAVAALAVVAFVVFVVAPFAKWLTTHFVVTTRRVIMRSGVFGRSGRDVPLYRINDVTFEHSFFERLLGAGSLIVESAGERGQVTLADIPHPEDVQREVYRLMEADDVRRRGDLPPE
ncbi:MAG TPA: PH domain-containing protein [Mycobacteriales bacterium]|nr:PH domain-containing protein [Mycobacteriales bacterium]